MSGFELTLPMALQAGSTILGMMGSEGASDTAERNAAMARYAGSVEAEIAKRSADIESASSKMTGDLAAANYRRAGQRQKAAAELEAQSLEQRAGQVVASAQRDVIDVKRVGELAQSRAIALAAASGGGASTSTTVVNIVGNLAKQTAMESMKALYSGEEQARVLRAQALSRRLTGEFAVEGAEQTAIAQEFSGNAGAIAAKFRGDAKSIASRLRGEAGGMAGDAAASAAEMQGIGNLIAGAGGLYEKYGRGGPSAVSNIPANFGYDYAGGPAYG